MARAPRWPARRPAAPPGRAPRRAAPCEAPGRAAALRAALCAALLLAPCALARAGLAARAAQAAQGSASVSGRVTDGERGIANVTVTLISVGGGERPRHSARARTDAEGRYRFEGVRAGRYQVLPHAPAHVTRERGEDWPPGSKTVSVLAGDSVEDVDFRLSRGGVITGRVTGADGQPIIAEPVTVAPVERGPRQERQVGTPLRVLTDDRGVYRAYGLAPGRYHVSVGAGTGAGIMRYASPRRFYRLTYHPDAAEAARAVAVEVTNGSEAEGVDISVGRPVKTHRALGRVVTAEGGQPVAGVRVGVGAVDPSGRRVMGYAGEQLTNARGEFVVENLVPGRYAAFLAGEEAGGWYSAPVVFDVGAADATGLELKLRRGATLSGVVQIEGVADRATLARLLSEVRVFAFHEPDGGLFVMGPPTFSAADGGTFQLAGLRPGKVRLNVETRVAGVAVVRVELGGADVGRTGIILAEGAQVSGVRVLLIYGTAVVRGQAATAGGGLPPNSRVIVTARRVGGETPVHRQANADASGRFQLDGLPAGTYEILGRAFGPGRPSQNFVSRAQQVFVAEGSEQQITLALEPTTTTPRPPGGP